MLVLHHQTPGLKFWSDRSLNANVRLILIAAGALLTGCVDTFAQLNSEIRQYKGRNIDALVDRIGYPDSQTFVAGRIVYTWTTPSIIQTDLQTMQAPRSWPETTNLHFRCTLQVDTNGTGTILDLSWEGKPSSCAP